FAPEHVVELVNELGVAIVDSKLDRCLQSAQLPGQVSGLLSHPGTVGMGGAVGVENAAAGDLQEDQDVESPQQHGVDGEEVAGQNRSGVGGEKLGPSRAIAARCRRHAMATKDAADGG